MNDKIKENYGRDTSLIYYDVTNYYFEIDEQNDFLRKGVSKEHRPNFGKIKKRFNLGRVISVADKGMTTSDNIWYTINTPAHDGYVFSMSIRGSEKSMKKYVLDDDGYVWLGKEYKRKSRKLYQNIIHCKFQALFTKFANNCLKYFFFSYFYIFHLYHSFLINNY